MYFVLRAALRAARFHFGEGFCDLVKDDPDTAAGV